MIWKRRGADTLPQAFFWNHFGGGAMVVNNNAGPVLVSLETLVEVGRWWYREVNRWKSGAPLHSGSDAEKWS
jgi:hypothetical protein